MEEHGFASGEYTGNFLGMLNINIYVLFLGQVVLGGAVYLGMAKLFKLEAFSYAERTIKELLRKS